MDSDIENIHIEFHGKAKDIFFNAVRQFEHATQSLNREEEEYRFSQLKEMHTNSMKQQLEIAAAAFVMRYQQHHQQRQINQNLQQIIHDYLHQFVLSIRKG